MQQHEKTLVVMSACYARLTYMKEYEMKNLMLSKSRKQISATVCDANDASM